MLQVAGLTPPVCIWFKKTFGSCFLYITFKGNKKLLGPCIRGGSELGYYTWKLMSQPLVPLLHMQWMLQIAVLVCTPAAPPRPTPPKNFLPPPLMYVQPEQLVKYLAKRYYWSRKAKLKAENYQHNYERNERKHAFNLQIKIVPLKISS